jgi:hypothetical protein
MGLQIGNLCGRIPAARLIACEGPLTRVHQHVPLEGAFFRGRILTVSQVGHRQKVAPLCASAYES